MRAIDHAIELTDSAEVVDELQKARNAVELLGSQCDSAEEARRYWCRVATRYMNQVDGLRKANSDLEVQVKVAESRLWPRKSA